MTKITEMENVVRRPEGCTELRVALQTASDGVLGYDSKIRLYGLEEINVNYNYVEGAGYSDNMQDTYRRKASSADIEIKLRQLSPKTEAMLMGKKFIEGKKITNSNDKAPKWAVSFKQTNSDNSFTYKEFYNCTVSREDGTYKTIKDGIEYDVSTLKIKALPLVDGNIDIEFDNDATGVTPADLASFKTTVMMPPTEEEASQKEIILTSDVKEEEKKNKKGE